jgi:hypothetical protein
VHYIFHTHPKTPYFGSRLIINILYEFPSISDILNFIYHHNIGILKGSIIFSPEGIYIIRKYNFDNNKIIIDENIFIHNITRLYYNIYDDVSSYYASYNFKQYKMNNYISIPIEIFYNFVAQNYSFINRINSFLINYNLFIEFYSRIKINENEWIYPDIYIS